IAGNMVIATVPASSVAALGDIPGVLRVVEDSRLESQLTTAPASTMVDPADPVLVGLWDANQTGGAYDPAIIDSGVDQDHPGMADIPSRTNYCSWYLVAASSDPDFNDSYSCDDEQSHGTHVAGIVGSYGTPSYPNHLGMAYGVEKMVNLKAGWLNSSTGGASMYWSDKYNLVDRALYNVSQLNPGTFADDVDGMNLSFGGDTSLDDTDGGRFWDSVISTYSDLPVTIAAGNSGPNNVNFSDPAVSYNAITVANYSDAGTTNRNDDFLNSSSTVGPTADGRRKPDIAAPGTSISAPNAFWETQPDYVNKSGTSMAAPMVLGVIMDLADAGVFDELAVKALLINTAQKNLPGMNIENDSDGWDPALGWGAMNAFAAYFHRFDVFQDAVAPRGTAGDYQLYKGTMRDEGAAGEGRDRATMVWNRVATYETAAPPSTYYSLPDLNLRLYQESNEALIDTDFEGPSNVQQVRIGAGASATDVVINAYAWSMLYAHGGATQPYVLATEEGFTRVDLPSQFQGVAIWPSSVEPNEVFDVTFWLRNDSEIASHNNVFNLELQPGWALISGIDTQDVGSAAGNGGVTSQVVYTLRAPNSEAGAQVITVKHSHESYNEPYGDFNWNINLTVETDNTPPNPSPMSFSTLPFNASTSSMAMTASFASDIHGPVEYYLDYTSSPSGGLGGSDSGWQSSRSFTDTGLQTNDEYCYRAWARDNASSPNTTSPSAIACSYTSQATPTGVIFGAVTTTSIEVASGSTPFNLTLGASGLRLRNVTAATASGWQQNNSPWVSSALTPASGYSFVAQARNGDGDITPDSPASLRYTLANPPAANSLTAVSDSQIDVELHPNGNSDQAEYFIQNTTAGTDSGWINSTSWSSAGLSCETSYNFQAKARNGDAIETIIVGLGSQSTNACGADTDGDGVPDASDNCTLVSNIDQRDTNGDGYGNICDPDLDNNNIVNSFDLTLLRNDFGSGGDLDSDLDGNGIVNTFDLTTMRSYFGSPPGPSGLAP
ncbi:MAG: S8 family serine peptidase, partial [Gammaproteobacteria bacterium]|nr:S8 family serine peptidase [Gammaproteobacteria bacterium]